MFPASRNQFHFVALATFASILFLLSTVMASGEEHPKGKMVGGWTEQDVNSDSIKEWANKAVTKYNQQSNDANQHIVAKVLSAQSQVVSGVKYRLKVEFGRTNCKKGDVCGDNEPVVSSKVYNVEIYSQPWTNTEEITFSEA